MYTSKFCDEISFNMQIIIIIVIIIIIIIIVIIIIGISLNMPIITMLSAVYCYYDHYYYH